MHKLWTAAIALTALAGCNKAEEPKNVTSIEVPEGNAETRIASMPEGERNGVFIRAIRDAGLPCQSVKTSAAGAPVQGQPSWSARCDSGDYVIVIGKDGTAAVVPPEAGITGNTQ
jgi:hypothetical protein